MWSRKLISKYLPHVFDLDFFLDSNLIKILSVSEPKKTSGTYVRRFHLFPIINRFVSRLSLSPSPCCSVDRVLLPIGVEINLALLPRCFCCPGVLIRQFSLLISWPCCPVVLVSHVSQLVSLPCCLVGLVAEASMLLSWSCCPVVFVSHVSLLVRCLCCFFPVGLVAQLLFFSSVFAAQLSLFLRCPISKKSENMQMSKMVKTQFSQYTLKTDRISSVFSFINYTQDLRFGNPHFSYDNSKQESIIR